MGTLENLGSLSVPELIERFENDIRFGHNSTFAEASRSQAGKELEKRKGVIPELHSRWKEMGEQTLNDVEKSVHVGIGMLIQWVEQK